MDVKAFMGALLSLTIILLFQGFLVSKASKRAKYNGTSRNVRFMDLLITSEDESYSLSRLQMYLWTVAAIMGYWAIFASTGKFPVIPETLYMLMGVNFATSVASTALNTIKAPPSQAAAATAATAATTPVEVAAASEVVALAAAVAVRASSPPDFIKDIFFESKDGKIQNSLDLPRTQMFIWTVISLGTFAVLLIKSPTELPEIKSGLVTLMGISNGAYLGAKAAKK